MFEVVTVVVLDVLPTVNEMRGVGAIFSCEKDKGRELKWWGGKTWAAEWGRGMLERVWRFIPRRRVKFEKKPEVSGSPGSAVGREAP